MPDLMPWLSMSWGRRGPFANGAPPHVTLPYRVHGLASSARCRGSPSPARPVPEVFETPQDEVSLFQIGPGPVSFSKGARYEFFKK